MFLAFLKSEKGRADICEGLLNQARSGKIVIVTSTFTMTEVVHIKGRERLTKDREKELDAFFKQPYIHLVDVTRRVCEEARQLMWRHPHLQPKDSLHLASALFGTKKQPDEVHSYDPDFTKLNRKIGSPPIVICEPYETQSSLPFGSEADA